MTPKKIAQFAIGPLGGALLGFVSLPIMTWVFSQEDIGRIALLNIFLSFNVLLFSLGLDQTYVRFYHETGCKNRLLKSVFIPGFFILSIAILPFLAFQGTLSKLIFDIDSFFISLTIVVTCYIAFINRFLALILRMEERGLSFSLSQILPKLLYVFIAIILLLCSFQPRFEYILAANVASLTFVFIIFIWSTRTIWAPALKERLVYSEVRELLMFGFPLIFGGVAFWGLTALDRVFLKYYSTYEELALYSVSVSFAAAGSIIQSIFSTVWAPTVYKWAAKGVNLNKIDGTIKYVLIVVTISFCLIGIFSGLINYMLPSNYGNVQFIVVSCFGYPLLYVLSETTVVGIGIAKRTIFAMLASVIACIVNIIGNYYLVPVYGAAGAAASTSISFYIFFILRTEFSIYLWRHIPRIKLYSFTTLSLFGAVIHALYGFEYNFLMKIYWIALLVICMSYFRFDLLQSVDYFKTRLKTNKSVQ
ncbi:lipopolysaccharide biosynthesis protein [Vibrio genomosp. F6]|uniref:Polysaccharide biosynthesis protein n=1 Tax=Vibrio genomosp. F6 str. FF-238 TaxID=1191298 RepID=A0A1E5D2G8_9VIBR|nr:oligosaccharide flippase family protein [Vibrio genomosp. F6]OEE77715.1 polysaccharide biosynthesis protein [Vibrio genomosp. F6 str. FF-238]